MSNDPSISATPGRSPAARTKAMPAAARATARLAPGRVLAAPALGEPFAQQRRVESGAAGCALAAVGEIDVRA